MVTMKARHFVFVLWVVAFGNCGGQYHKANQEQPLVSPSGKYVLTVPIERAADKLHYWRVTISDVNGNVLFKDDSQFVGRLNVYWSWDAHDRVWLNNSDNGYTYYWELDQKNRWRRFQCRHERSHQFPPASPSPDESGVVPELLPCSLSPLKK